MILRPAASDDLEDVARIWLEAWLSTGIVLGSAPTYDVLRSRIAVEIAGGWVVTVADIDGAVVGFVAIDPDVRQLEQIFVDPRHQGAGVGAALLAHAHAAMPDGFGLWTHGDNHRAADFYARRGMTLVGPGFHPRQGHAILTFAMPPVTA
ncbi:MAG: GNAT family N-acetyltransferase [Sphingobium sp.]|nr:GNAT family N-acetyltransferase [Sphingobium sp.]